MAAPTVKKPRCADCMYRFLYGEIYPRREGGINLQPGREYCKGGRKYRAFKKSDPKITPPSWCPRLKSPCEFRIYTFKDADTWFFYYLTNKDGIPDGRHCAVRASGTVELSPFNFFSMLEEKSASELLGVEVRSGEIVEIDDGLKSCCFYIKFGECQYLPYWNAAQAQKNLYQNNKEED